MAQHRDINHTGLTGVSTVSYASNANQTSTANYGGDATTVSRGDHVHLSTGGSGNVATDAIWDAAGDTVVGSGANTAVKRKNNDGAAAAPAVTDDSSAGYTVGSRWIDTTADKEYVALDVTVGAAVWTETTAAAGGTSLLAYTAGVAGTETITSATIADLPTHGISVTFTAPASTNVLVRLTAVCAASATANSFLYWGLREDTTTIAGAAGTSSTAIRQPNVGTNATVISASKVFILTGISAGSHTYKWAAAASTSGATISADANGPAVMEVWALP